VGFVGAVGLRKGVPWFLETAKRFNPNQVRFAMVGLVVLDKTKLEPFADRVQFVGAVPHSQVAEWLRKFDVFFFPSTCEGSAGAVLEAMSAGLPVITTLNSGSWVRDGIDGFIRSYDDIDGFEQALRQLDDDRDLLQRMGESARARVLTYDLNAYQNNLLRFFERVVGPKL
jgi:glycosyltransferase involved in cell wall biosynthesis